MNSSFGFSIACTFISGLLGAGSGFSGFAIGLEISASTLGLEISAVTLDSGLSSRFFFQPKTGSHPQLGWASFWASAPRAFVREPLPILRVELFLALALLVAQDGPHWKLLPVQTY
jgi:hypothetical protein